MTKKTCPLGEDCDLTIAWMLGRESAKAEYKAKIAAAEGSGMTDTDTDWEAEIEALDASLPERLERAARMAERSDIWTNTERLMPATGVADLIWEAHSEILGWRALNRFRRAEITGEITGETV